MHKDVRYPDLIERVDCPVCGNRTDRVADAVGWGEWRTCRECTLEFAYPLRLGHDPKVLFDAAYQGKVQASAMTDFGRRVAQRRAILDQLQDPSLWFWTPAFSDVLTWLKTRINRGSTVLELGCGLGFFLHALRREGYCAVGLDVADTVVKLNRDDGFRVWHGPVETLPPGWVKPDAVVSFFMLHHLDDPLRFLRAIRERAPTAPLAIAVYGPTNRGTAASMPPRTLIRWNARALATALDRAGYASTVREVQSTGSERYFLKDLRALLARTREVPWMYRVGKRVESGVLSRMPKKLRQDAYVVLAMGEPVPNTTPGE